MHDQQDRQPVEYHDYGLVPQSMQGDGWLTQFEQMRQATQAQELTMQPVERQPSPITYQAPYSQAPTYQSPVYQPPTYHAPGYEAPRYGAYAPEFKPTIIVHTTSSVDNSGDGRGWLCFVLGWFILVPLAIAVGGK